MFSAPQLASWALLSSSCVLRCSCVAASPRPGSPRYSRCWLGDVFGSATGLLGVAVQQLCAPMQLCGCVTSTRIAEIFALLAWRCFRLRNWPLGRCCPAAVCSDAAVWLRHLDQ